ncbi:MAG: biopolymer transporter ExbD, partial [Singulisphaera sp.]
SVSLAELTAKLAGARQQYAELGVMVRGDGSGEFQRVADVLNACKQAGIAQLAISVKVDQKRR